MPPVIVCSTPNGIVAAFAGTSATSITLPRGGSVDIETVYATNNDASPCTHTINWNRESEGGLLSSFATRASCSADVTYTETFTPPEAGTWTVTTNLVWTSENPPDEESTVIIVESNELTVVAWAGDEEVEARLVSRTATAGAEQRTADASAETRTATAAAPPRTKAANLETRTATAGAELREVSGGLETRTATAGAESHDVAAAVETRTATAGVRARSVVAELPVRTAGGGMSG